MKRIAIFCFLVLALAAPARAIGVTSINVVGSTVTVTTPSAHGFVVNQGVCLTATPTCTAIATVPGATTFTFTQPSNTAVAVCAASCGTATAAPKVIVLSVDAATSSSQKVVHYLLWLTTTSPIPSPGAASVWRPGSGSAGATVAQSNAIAAGNFIEVNRAVSFPASMSTVQMQTFVQSDFTDSQAALVANTQPGAYYGSTWDGSLWAVQ